MEGGSTLMCDADLIASQPPEITVKSSDSDVGVDHWTHTVTGGPWPERMGLRCRIVPPPATWYPWDRPDDWGVIVLIEDDPIAIHEPSCARCGWQEPPVWSCRLNRSDITPNGDS